MAPEVPHAFLLITDALPGGAFLAGALAGTDDGRDALGVGFLMTGPLLVLLLGAGSTASASPPRDLALGLEAGAFTSALSQYSLIYGQTIFFLKQG